MKKQHNHSWFTMVHPNTTIPIPLPSKLSENIAKWKRIHGGSVNYMGQRSGNPTNRFRTTRLLMSIRAGALDNGDSQRNDR